MTSEPAPGRGRLRTALSAELWPRTLRPALVSWFLSPFNRSRASRRRIDAAINAPSLPAPIATLISRVITRTRLWPTERLDVARELVAHFTDGLDAGRTPAELIAGFGDPVRAARLIARAKKRSRPLWSRALAHTRKAAGVLLLLFAITYAYLAARYFLPSPNIARNYATEFNAPIEAIPKADRAWTHYLRAIRELELPTDLSLWWALPAHPEEDRFAEAAAFARSRQTALVTIRHAASLLRLGSIFSGTVDPEYRAIQTEFYHSTFTSDPSQPAPENPPLMGVLLPALGELHRFSRVLAADAHDAAALNDRERFLADVDALLGMGDQCFAEPFVISRVVGVMIGQFACEVSLRQLSAPGFLTDADRTRLAHRFAAFGAGAVRLNAPGESAMWHDLVQRFFSDDGHGGGHLIEGAARQFYMDWGVSDPTHTVPLLRAGMPLVAATHPSRATLTAQIERSAAAFGRDDTLPLWRESERTSQAEFDRLTSMLYPTEHVARSLQGDNHYRDMLRNRDRFETLRATLLAACALESHRSTHSTYPADLSALIPDLLPSLPLDPYDGKPLRYLLSSGRPVLYSIGPDLTDDHATPPRESDSAPSKPDRTLPTPGQPADWILYRTAPAPR